MTGPDITRMTEAELARFCAVNSAHLTRLQQQIAASATPEPGLEAAFDQTAAQLQGAVDELQTRIDQASRTTT